MHEDNVSLLIGIDSKVDEVKEKLHNIEIVQTRMESDLKYHIRRTDILEEKVMDIDEKIKPMEGIKDFAIYTGKVVAFIGTLTMLIVSLMKLFSKQ
jgi:hypothetical protein